MRDAINTETVSAFKQIRESTKGLALIKATAERWVDQCIVMMFPELCQEVDCSQRAISDDINQIWSDFSKLRELVSYSQLTLQVAADKLLMIREELLDDAQAAFEGDPACRSVQEVILAYPGFAALAHYRIAHALHQAGYPLIPRIIAEKAHRQTGIDIHPGAVIGRRCFIDHGTGVVIGETAVVGSDVKIYQGVTLGALSVAKNLSNTKRHPTVEDRVVLYANAIVLGGDTVIGSDSVIGGNSWVTSSVPPNSTITRKT